MICKMVSAVCNPSATLSEAIDNGGGSACIGQRIELWEISIPPFILLCTENRALK